MTCIQIIEEEEDYDEDEDEEEESIRNPERARRLLTGLGVPQGEARAEGHGSWGRQSSMRCDGIRGSLGGRQPTSRRAKNRASRTSPLQSESIRGGARPGRSRCADRRRKRAPLSLCDCVIERKSQRQLWACELWFRVYDLGLRAWGLA